LWRTPNLTFSGCTEPLIHAQTNNHCNPGKQQESGKEHHGHIFPLARLEDSDQCLQEYGDANGRNKLGDAAPCLAGIPHLSGVNDLFFKDVFGDLKIAMAMTM
jgi:hypothetical protein